MCCLLVCVLFLCNIAKNKENVLFLTPTMTEELMNYNDELINVLSKNNIHCFKLLFNSEYKLTGNRFICASSLSSLLLLYMILRFFSSLFLQNNIKCSIFIDEIAFFMYNNREYAKRRKFWC